MSSSDKGGSGDMEARRLLMTSCFKLEEYVALCASRSILSRASWQCRINPKPDAAIRPTILVEDEHEAFGSMDDNEHEWITLGNGGAQYIDKEILCVKGADIFRLLMSFVHITYTSDITSRCLSFSMLRSLLQSFHMSTLSSATMDFTRLRNILPASLKPVPINQSRDLARDDQTDDAQFYCVPRFVHHIDDRARSVLSQFYAYAIKQTKETKTLDICSSWTSHLPKDFVGEFNEDEATQVRFYPLCRPCSWTWHERVRIARQSFAERWVHRSRFEQASISESVPCRNVRLGSLLGVCRLSRSSTRRIQ